MVALLGLYAHLSAQTCAPAELQVFVVDSQGAAVFETEVKMQPAATPSAAAAPGEELPVRGTGTRGFADFTAVACGLWEVTASKTGFESTMVLVPINRTGNLEVTLTLEPKRQSESVDVTETAPPVEQSVVRNNVLRPADIETLPINPATVDQALPLEPGVVRTPDGEARIDGAGQERSSMVVNQSDITDPATGKFSQSIPVDAIESMNVLNAPFLAQYGRFTQSVVAVETRRGGEKWHAQLNDVFPDFRALHFHLLGIRDETPRFVLGGPLIKRHLYFISSLQYLLTKFQNRTLTFPDNVSKRQSINSFSQLDYVLSTKQILTATFQWNPQQTNFVNPNFFNPQPVTPSFAQQFYSGTAIDRYAFFNGLIDSSVSFQRFDATVGAQASGPMTILPQGNQGNFFASQVRGSRRTEWLETWSLAPFQLAGTHLVKMGSSVTGTGDQGSYDFRPVNIENAAGVLEENISFTNQAPFNRTDLEVSAYAQDHWALTPRFSVDYGARIEHQRLAQNLRIAPRVGLAWSPFDNNRTVLRAGYGTFYDHLPLDVYTFGRYPLRTVTYYAPDGSVIGEPVSYENVIGSLDGPRTFLVHGQQVAGDFSPRGATANVQIEHAFSSLFRVRGVYMDNKAVGLVVIDPEGNQIVLNGNGQSRYRQLEVTGKFTWKNSQQLNLTYTHSRSEGSLNTFDYFLGNFPSQLVRPDLYGNLPADVPNRLLAWGRMKTHIWDVDILPMIEFRTGFPFAVLDAMQNYVGIPYSDATRFPDYFSADARLMKDIALTPKYKVRLSVTGLNLTNRFNPLAVHDNVADPAYGVFLGSYHRRYLGDFEVLF